MPPTKAGKIVLVLRPQVPPDRLYKHSVIMPRGVPRGVLRVPLFDLAFSFPPELNEYTEYTDVKILYAVLKAMQA